MGFLQSTPDPVGSTQSTQFRPQDIQQINRAVSGLTQGTNQFAQQAQQAGGQLSTNFSQFSPSLQTQFQGPQFSPTLDPFSQNIVSAGLSNIQGQQAATGRQIQRQFGQGGAGDVLRFQSQFQGRQAGAQLPFAAATQQRGRQVEEFQLGQQAQQLGNQAALAQSQNQANLQQLGNQAVGQQLGFSQLGLGQQQNLLGVLAGLAQLFGTKQTLPTPEQ